MSTENMDELEIVARAVCGPAWETTSEYGKSIHRKDAQAALTSLSDAGYRLAGPDWVHGAAHLVRANFCVSADGFSWVAKRSDEGVGWQHACWLLDEIIEKRVTGTKAHRWLGYAQSTLVHHGYITLRDAKQLNKVASAMTKEGKEL